MGYFLNTGSNVARVSSSTPVARLGVELHFLNFPPVELSPVRLGFLHASKKHILEAGFGSR